MVRKLTVEFGDELDTSLVMGGLSRSYGDPGLPIERQRVAGLLRHWLEAADATSMPLDPLLWTEGPIHSTYPACMAVEAAGEQRQAEPYLRAVREGLMCFRRKLDTTEALVEEARRAGLDVERFRIDLASNAIVEKLGADLERARNIPEAARAEDGAVVGDRLTLPSFCFPGAEGEEHWVFGFAPYERYREAAEAAGARPSGSAPLSVGEALRRFGRMATREVELVCALPGPRAAAELWRLATEWQVRPVRVLTGYLWEPV